MKSIPLRELLRETRKIKRLTNAGASFLVTDHGEPLWKVSPADDTGDAARDEHIDAELDALLNEPRSDIPLSELVLRSRR